MKKDRSEFSDIGNLCVFLDNYRQDRIQDYSYLSGKWADHEQWRSMAKAKVFELLGYFPKEATLDAETLSITECSGYRQHEIRFNSAMNVRVAGSLLIPTQGEKPYPAVVALHDHGGFYYYGREKSLEQDPEPEILKQYKELGYGGRSWASELARHGYVVLSIDAFYFGSRKLDLETVSSRMYEWLSMSKLEDMEPGSIEYIQTYNFICSSMEQVFMKYVLMSGTSWAGILFHDDRKSVDYLLSRDEVDPDRIGCCGLSIGGLRSVYLAGLDDRIKASVATGWMPTSDSLLFNRCCGHTLMLYTPLMTSYLDIPDVASLTAPHAIFIQQCTQDLLYNMKGMQDACTKIEKVYAKLGIPEKFKGSFYDNGHEFNLQMQEDAFDWLDQWLK